MNIPTKFTLTHLSLLSFPLSILSGIKQNKNKNLYKTKIGIIHFKTIPKVSRNRTDVNHELIKLNIDISSLHNAGKHIFEKFPESVNKWVCYIRLHLSTLAFLVFLFPTTFGSQRDGAPWSISWVPSVGPDMDQHVIFFPSLFSYYFQCWGKKSLGAARVRYKETKWFSEIKCTITSRIRKRLISSSTEITASTDDSPGVRPSDKEPGKRGTAWMSASVSWQCPELSPNPSLKL